MPDVNIEHQPTLDLLPIEEPKLSSVSDMPKVETKPDAAPAKPEAAKPTLEGKKPGEQAPPEKPEADPAASDEPEKKPAKGVQKRIDELVRQREAAERRAEAEQAEKLRLLALVERGAKPAADKLAKPDEDQEPSRPSREAFADTAAYESALGTYADTKADWSARRAVKDILEEEGRKAQQREIEAGQQAARDAYNARVEKAKAKYADFEEVAQRADVTVSIPMAHAILHSEHGPDIQHHFGKHPDEAKRISALNPVEQLLEIGLIVGRLTATQPAAPAAPAVLAKPAVSAAPKPITPITPGTGEISKDPEKMSMDEYAEYAKKRDGPARRPGVRH